MKGWNLPNVVHLLKNVHWFSVALLTLKFISLRWRTTVHYRVSWSPCIDLLWFIVVKLLSASLLMSQYESLDCPSISLNISFYYVGTLSCTVTPTSQLVVSEHAVAESVSCGLVLHASSVRSPFPLAVFNPTWQKQLTLGSPDTCFAALLNYQNAWNTNPNLLKSDFICLACANVTLYRNVWWRLQRF